MNTYMQIHKQTWMWIPLLYGILLVCYYPVFSNGFLDSWDDQWMVMNVYTESGWSVKNIYAIFMQTYHGQYSPLVQINYLLIYSLFGYNPMVYHLVSFLWHVSCVTVLYILLQQIIYVYDRGVTKHCALMILLTTTIFAVHPVQVESIAWISAVKVPMYTLFYLSAILFYIKYTKLKEFHFYLFTLLCFLCSALCKEQAVIFPILLVLIDWFIGRDWKDLDVWLEKLPFVMISIGFAYLTWNMQQGRNEASLSTFLQRILFGCYSLFEYITKSIFPLNLNYLYPFPIPDCNTDIPIRFYVYPLWTVGLLMCLYYYRYNRILIFGSLFFLIHLLPLLHVIPIPRISIVADRYLYISLVGILLLVSRVTVFLFNKYSTKILRVCLISILLVYVGYLCAYTHCYCGKWKDSNTVKAYLRGFYTESTIKQSME